MRAWAEAAKLASVISVIRVFLIIENQRTLRDSALDAMLSKGSAEGMFSI